MSKKTLSLAPDLTRILQIARSKGVFSVSWRYRDERLARFCLRAAARGELARIWRGPGSYDFTVPGAEPPAGFRRYHARRPRARKSPQMAAGSRSAAAAQSHQPHHETPPAANVAA